MSVFMPHEGTRSDTSHFNQNEKLFITSTKLIFRSMFIRIFFPSTLWILSALKVLNPFFFNTLYKSFLLKKLSLTRLFRSIGSVTSFVRYLLTFEIFDLKTIDLSWMRMLFFLLPFYKRFVLLIIIIIVVVRVFRLTTLPSF